jgi:hypothetical protein
MGLKDVTTREAVVSKSMTVTEAIKSQCCRAPEMKLSSMKTNLYFGLFSDDIVRNRIVGGVVFSGAEAGLLILSAWPRHFCWPASPPPSRPQ